MNRISLATIAIAIALAGEAVPATLTFEEALALAEKNTRLTSSEDFTLLRRGRMPNVRAEMTGNVSRTLDVFTEGPLENRLAVSVIAFDLPLWGEAPGFVSGRASARTRLEDARFGQLVEAFGELYFTQQQIAMFRPVREELGDMARRGEQLLAEGEITNLIASERRDMAVAYATRVVDLEARRSSAAARLRAITGMAEEPAVVLSLDTRALLQEGERAEDDSLRELNRAVEERRARYRAVSGGNRFRAMLSGFGGVGSASSDFRGISSEGSFGIYGLRLHLSYPLFGTSGLAGAEARLALEQSIVARDAALEAVQTRAAEYRSREKASRERIPLLRESVAAAKVREDSLRRLVAAGLRTESELTLARAERLRREGDLMAADVEGWKAARLLSRLTGEDRPRP
jgi:outer membrane protein TolC